MEEASRTWGWGECDAEVSTSLTRSAEWGLGKAVLGDGTQSGKLRGLVKSHMGLWV